MSPSLDSQSQINLKCLPLHKITSPIAPIPSSIPIETQWTQSSWLPHHRRQPDGIETFPELNYHPEYAIGCSVICRCAVSMANPLSYHWGIGPRPRQLANSLTISLRGKSIRTPAVTAPYGEARNTLVSAEDWLQPCEGLIGSVSCESCHFICPVNGQILLYIRCWSDQKLVLNLWLPPYSVGRTKYIYLST